MIVGLENISRELISWYENSPSKAINIVSVPYQGFAPLQGLLARIAGRERILCVSREPAKNESLLGCLKALGLGWSRKEDRQAKLVILDFEEAFQIRDNYDLILCDDLNLFPNQPRRAVRDLLNHVYAKGRRVIAYSLERVFSNVITLELPLAQKHDFVTEPRFIDTKLDIRSGIPNTIYEFIDFFHFDRRHVMIFVPDASTSQGMTDYLRRINPALAKSLHDVTGQDHGSIASFLAEQKAGTILFSQLMEDFRDIPVNFEFIVSNADLACYDYRKFVFLCLRSGLCADRNGEVLLVAQGMTRDMQRAKELTQSYNRVLWEEDQLFL